MLSFDVSKTRTASTLEGISSQSRELQGHPAGHFSWTVLFPCLFYSPRPTSQGHVFFDSLNSITQSFSQDWLSLHVCIQRENIAPIRSMQSFHLSFSVKTYEKLTINLYINLFALPSTDKLDLNNQSIHWYNLCRMDKLKTI